MFWLGMLIDSVLGGTLAIAFHCMLIVGKEADKHNEYFDEHSIK